MTTVELSVQFTHENLHYGDVPVGLTNHVLAFTYPYDPKKPFLSNLFITPISVDNKEYPCAEAAYQASKTDNPVIKNMFTTLDGGSAFTRSKELGLRHKNPNDALQKMFTVLSCKFRSLHSDSRLLLQATGDAFLLAIGSDLVWSARKNGWGLNMIGFMLMYIRDLNAMDDNDNYVVYPWFRWLSQYSVNGLYARDIDPDNSWQQFVILACSALRDHETSTCANRDCERPSCSPHRYCSRTCARAYRMLQ